MEMPPFFHEGGCPPVSQGAEPVVDVFLRPDVKPSYGEACTLGVCERPSPARPAEKGSRSATT